MTINSMFDLVVIQCAAEGVSLSIDGDSLVMSGRQAAIEEWRPLLRSLKPRLLGMLPHGVATIRRRTADFMRYGVGAVTASKLALRLDIRDLQRDERRLCLECSHLTGTQHTYRCNTQWEQAKLGGQQLPRELPTILQRCKSFRPMA